MESANLVTIPADPHHETCAEEHTTDGIPTNSSYREAVGSLLYLTTETRPDLAFAVSKAGRYMEKPTKIQCNAVKRIFKYLKGTLDYGLKFSPTCNNNLKIYSDADFARELETRRSTSGYITVWGTNILNSPGVHNYNPQWLCQLQRRNIYRLAMPLKILCGSANYFMRCMISMP